MGRSTEEYEFSFLSECSPPNAWICRRFTGSRCTCNWQMPHTGAPKAEKLKMRKSPERSPHCGLLWIGGRRLQPPAFILQPNRRQIPVDLVPSFLLRLPFLGNALRLSLPQRAHSTARSSLLRPLPDGSRKAPHTAKHGLTGGTAACVEPSHPTGQSSFRYRTARAVSQRHRECAACLILSG